MPLLVAMAVPVTLPLGDANVFQIVRMSIECPTEDTPTVTLEMQASTTDAKGVSGNVFPLPPVVLDAMTSAKVYQTIRDLIYQLAQSASPLVPKEAVLSSLAPIQPIDSQAVSDDNTPVSEGS